MVAVVTGTVIQARVPLQTSPLGTRPTVDGALEAFPGPPGRVGRRQKRRVAFDREFGQKKQTRCHFCCRAMTWGWSRWLSYPVR